MQIKEVRTRKDGAAFLEAHVLLNTENPNWVRPLNKDINDIFDLKKNKLLSTSKAMRWLLYDEHQNLIGRIAAFVNPKYTNKEDKQPTGGIGFFDCINNQDAANLLFDTAKEWLKEQRMEAMDGPINLGERDKWWGLLVDGFHQPVYGMNYNPPYYQGLFEQYGFEVFYNQLCFYIDLTAAKRQVKAEKYEVHAQFAKNNEYRIETLSKQNIDKFASDFTVIYNKAWAVHEGGKSISEDKARKLFRNMKPIIRKHIGWIAYHKNQPVALWLNIPDLNLIFKQLNGKFGWWQKLIFLKKINEKSLTGLVGIIYGIITAYHGSGVDDYMIIEAEKDLKSKTGFRDLELQWIGDFNPKMLAIARYLDTKENRRLSTYRYLFDRNAQFKRHPYFN